MKYSFLTTIQRRKLKYFGHVVRAENLSTDILRGSRKSRQKTVGLKDMANFYENRKNHGKITAKIPVRHQLMGVKTSGIDDHRYMQCKVFICKILSSWSHIEPVHNRAHGLW